MAIFGSKRIYLDHAASTPLSPRAKAAMDDAYSRFSGNPSAIHTEGLASRAELERLRKKFAELLGVHADEIVFTSGGTEGNTLALLGAVRTDAARAHGKHIVASAYEHASVARVLELLEKEGFEISYVEPDVDGVIHPKVVAQAIRPDTVLVTVMMAHNEIGTINPIAEIGRAVRRGRAQGSPFPLFHTDACQALGHREMMPSRLGVDLVTMSAHKMYGPRGIGALFVRRGTELVPLFVGGGQESGIRSGTENAAGVAGMVAALEEASELLVEEAERLTALRQSFIARILRDIPGVVVHGHPTLRLPGNINISIAGTDSEEVVVRLDAVGIAASSGAACSAGDGGDTRAILALGKGEDAARSALRFSLGRGTTERELERTAEVLRDIVRAIREKSSRGFISDAVSR